MDPNSVRILLDQCADADTLRLGLRSYGIDVVSVADFGLTGEEDDLILRAAHEDDRIVFTYDCDDFQTLHASGMKHSGVMVSYPSRGIQLPTATITAAVSYVTQTLGEDLAGKLIVINHFQGLVGPK